MTVYIGVDFHARCQTIVWMDDANGEIHQVELDHRKDDVRGFYQQMPPGTIVGFECSGYTAWFEELLEELGHEIWAGDPAEIRRRARRRQKNDRRDAALVLDLLVKREFPRVHRRTGESSDVLRQLRHRHRMVKMRTMISNGLQAVAIGSGMHKKVRVNSRAGRSAIERMQLRPVFDQQRKSLLGLLDELTQRISVVERWLEDQASGDDRVARLQTHPGFGLLTSLALVHVLEPVERFSTSRKVAAYLGLDPMENSSADKKRYGSISKAGAKVVRFLLGEAGQSAAKNDPDLRRFYQRLAIKRNRSIAKVAVARKLAVRGFTMLRDQIDYEEFLRRGVQQRRSNSKASSR